jgi:hypothetical protein
MSVSEVGREMCHKFALIQLPEITAPPYPQQGRDLTDLADCVLLTSSGPMASASACGFFHFVCIINDSGFHDQQRTINISSLALTYRAPPILLHLVKSFLTNRTQTVRVDGVLSSHCRKMMTEFVSQKKVHCQQTSVE